MSGPFKIACPQCGREGKTPAEPAVGAKVRCPGCKAQFAYSPAEDFVIVEPPPGGVKPSAAIQDGHEGAWSALIALAVVAVTLMLVVGFGGGRSGVENVAGVMFVLFIVASPLVLVGCLIYLAVKHAAKQALRENDDERAKR